MPTIAILSDTHVPARVDAIPEWVREVIRAADHTVHAGDFETPAVLDEVRDLADDDLTAVAGNADPENIDLPEVATLETGGVTFVVTHGTGAIDLDDYRERVARIVRETAEDPDAVGISGHTHRVMDEEVDGVRLLNPGSATGITESGEATMMQLTVEDGEVEVELLRE